MTRIAQLITELHPKGIEFTALGELVSIQTGEQLNKTSFLVDGKFLVFNGGTNASGRTNQSNTSANTVIVSQGGASAGFVNFVTSAFWAGAHCYVVSPSTSLNARFLFFWLKSMESELRLRKQGAGIPGLSKSALSSLLVPVISMEVQLEIVKVLDTFIKLEAQLEAELEARRKQYEYYRNQLLSFPEQGEVRWVPMGSVCLKVTSGGTPRSHIEDYYRGTIPWLRTQEVDFGIVRDTQLKITQEALDSSSANWIPANTVIVAMYGATAGKVAVNAIPLTTNQACCNLQVDPSRADYRYVFQWIKHNYSNLKKLGQGTQNNLTGKQVKEFLIPLPDLDIQRRIAEILDVYEGFLEKITGALPSEIEARRKQYEYYRDKLLTFTELQAS
jgi:type I restriction enzyme S subunit